MKFSKTIVNSVAVIALAARNFSVVTGLNDSTTGEEQQKLIDLITFDISPASSPAELDRILEHFESHGLVVINADIPNKEEMVEEARLLSERALENLKSIAGEDVCYNDIPLSPYENSWQVTDLAMRAYKRYDIRLDSNSILRSFTDSPAVVTVAKTLLGTDDVHIVDVGFVVACPGANLQDWHKDDAGTPGTRKALGVFFPLVANPDERFGSTEFQSGSQKYDSELGYEIDYGEDPNGVYLQPSLDNGEFLVYDYLTSHRGYPNVHDEPRRLMWMVIGGPDYHADEANWMPPGCEVATDCGKETIRYQWGLDEAEL